MHGVALCVCMCLQHSVSLAAHHLVGWRRASHAHWVSTSLVLAHARVCPALWKPPPSTGELWSRVNVEVSLIYATQSLSHTIPTLSTVIDFLFPNLTSSFNTSPHLLHLFLFFYLISSEPLLFSASCTSSLLFRAFLSYWTGSMLPLSSWLLPAWRGTILLPLLPFLWHHHHHRSQEHPRVLQYVSFIIYRHNQKY